MPAATIFVKTGDVLTLIGVPADAPVPPIVLPVDPGYSPPWATVPPGMEGGPPKPPPNWRPEHPEHPIANPWPPYVDANPPLPQPPIDPTTPPPNLDNGNWTWAWSPQAGRWVWVKVPGEGEAGPKAA